MDDFGWGGLRVELPGNQPFFQGRVDLPDSTGIDVDVIVNIDVETGVATWILQTVDPVTGEAPSDALAGFLPPNNSEGIGEGFVTYTVRAKAPRQPLRWSMPRRRLSSIKTSQSTRRPYLIRSMRGCPQAWCSRSRPVSASRSLS